MLLIANSRLISDSRKMQSNLERDGDIRASRGGRVFSSQTKICKIYEQELGMMMKTVPIGDNLIQNYFLCCHLSSSSMNQQAYL